MIKKRCKRNEKKVLSLKGISSSDKFLFAIFFSFIFLFCISSVSAKNIYSDCSIYGICKTDNVTNFNNVSNLYNVTNITYSGGGEEWNNNYSDFLVIKAWNDTGLIKDWNSTGLIINWSSGVDLSNYFTKAEINAFDWINLTIGNANFYPLNSNPFGYYNATTIPTYLTAEVDPFWNANYSDYLGLFLWNKTYADTLYADISVTGDDTSWNKTYADTLYSGIEWDYNQTIPAITYVDAQGFLTSYTETDPKAYNGTLMYASNWNATNESYYLKNNPFGYWNSTFATFNKTYADTLYAPIGFVGGVTGEQLAGNITNFYLNTTNQFSYYNSTTIPSYLTAELDPFWSDNFTLYNSSWSSTYNSTYDSKVSSQWTDTLYGLYYDGGNVSLGLNSYFIVHGFGLDYQGDIGWNNFQIRLQQSNTNTLNLSGANLYLDASKDVCIIGGNCLSTAGVGSGDVTGEMLYGNITNFYLNTTNQFGYYNATTIPSYLTAELDPFWSDNFTLYNASWSYYEVNTDNWNTTEDIWNVVNNGTFYIDNIHSYYNSTTIPSYLTAELDPFWNANYSNYLGLFLWNKTYADTLYADISVTGDDTSWNKTYADTLYSGIEWDYNQTIPAITYVDAQGFLTSYTETDPKAYNGTLMYASNWNATNESYYLKTNPFGYYNSTTLTDLNATGLIKDWNSTGLIINWSSGVDLSNYFTKAEINAFDWINLTIGNANFYPLNSNPFGYYNSTTLPTSSELDPFWSDNFTLYNASWSYYEVNTDNWNTSSQMWAVIDNGTFLKTYTETDPHAYNGTLMYASDWNATNESYYLKNNPFGYYNSTTIPNTEDPRFVNLSTGGYNYTSNGTYPVTTLIKEGTTGSGLFISIRATEPTLQLENLGGNGGATFAFKDTLSNSWYKFKAVATGGFKIRDQTNGVDFFVANNNMTANAIYLKGNKGGFGVYTNTPEYEFDVNAVTRINKTFILSDLSSTYTGGSAHVCVYNNGTLWSSEGACP